MHSHSFCTKWPSLKLTVGCVVAISFKDVKSIINKFISVIKGFIWTIVATCPSIYVVTSPPVVPLLNLFEMILKKKKKLKERCGLGLSEERTLFLLTFRPKASSSCNFATMLRITYVRGLSIEHWTICSLITSIKPQIVFKIFWEIIIYHLEIWTIAKAKVSNDTFLIGVWITPTTYVVYKSAFFDQWW